MEEKKKTSKKDSTNQNLQATIYESVDKKKDGGELRTKIYCFQTNYPIVEMA